MIARTNSESTSDSEPDFVIYVLGQMFGPWIGDFFQPWRRKIGALMLLLACVFMAGWMRSNTVCDRVFLGRTGSFEYLESRRGRLAWERFDKCYVRFLKWESSDASNDEDIDLHESSRYTEWRWRFAGCTFGFKEFPVSSSSQFCVIPYWSVVIPLTSLSAYLLLSKPRAKKIQVTTP